MDAMEENPLFKSALDSIANLFREGRKLCPAFSGGKDSSVVALLTLTAARDAVQAGLQPMVVVTTGNTLVDNPEVTMHVHEELRKMRLYAERHGFKLITKVVSPSLASTWQVKVLTGRGLPSYVGQNADCSINLKIEPQRAFRRKLFKKLRAESSMEPIVLIGTRREESAKRALKMAERMESATTPVRNSDGEFVLSPIADWSVDDVWEIIGLAANGLIDSYSTFEETRRIYAAAESTSCAVVADALATGRKRGGCGARTGCWCCLQAEDKSLENMVNFEPRYEYARGLIRLNRFLRNIRYDWSRRNWIGRSIRGNFIAVQPDTFHPSTLRELLRYMLQLDFDEQARSEAEGGAPMFQLLTPEMLVAIDAYWSLNGSAQPYSVWADYRDIFQRGVRFDIPNIDPVPETPLPKPKYLHVGDNWDGDNALSFTGMRNSYVEALTEGSACSPELRERAEGSPVWDLETHQQFSVDSESAFMLMDFEMDNMLAKYEAGVAPGGITAGYLAYIQYGALSLSHSQLLEHDKILKRTAFKDRLGLTNAYNIEELLAKSVEFADLPEEAKAAWSHKESKKATPVQDPEGWAQSDMFELLAA